MLAAILLDLFLDACHACLDLIWTDCVFWIDLLSDNFANFSVLIKFPTVGQSATFVVAWLIIVNCLTQSLSIVKLTIILSSPRVVLDLGIIDRVKIILLEESLELGITSVLDQLELFLSPHVEGL